MSESQYEDEPLEIVGEDPVGRPAPFPPAQFFLWALVDALHVALEGLAVDDPRAGTDTFAVQIETALDRLADVRAHLLTAYPRGGGVGG